MWMVMPGRAVALHVALSCTERKTGGGVPMEEMIDIYDADRNRTGLTVAREGAFMEEGQYMLYVLAIIEDAQGRFLITQRALDKSWGAGWWEVTGGGVLSGETSAQAVVREVREEVGLDISGLPLSPVYAYENIDLKRGDNYIVDIYRFQMDVCESDVKLQDSEAIGCRFATWDEICALAQKGEFLHFERLRQALGV